MADTLFELSERTNLTTGEQALLDEMTTKLRDGIPELNNSYDEQTGLLTLNKDAVYELIAAREKEMLRAGKC